jgi:hypothetical protein
VYYGAEGDSGNFGNGGDAGGLSGRESFSLDFEIILASFCGLGGEVRFEFGWVVAGVGIWVVEKSLLEVLGKIRLFWSF